jgi:hypothetical protein
MTQRRSISLVYVFLLLFAQQSAFTHAAWHALGHPQQHQQDKGKASFQGDLCALHSAFSEVLGGVQAGAIPLDVSQGVAEAIPYRSRPSVVLQTHLPLSRGPPVSS